MGGWLTGKVGLMVGGGSGIGRAVIDAFRSEGGTVAVLERDAEKCAALRELGDDVLTVCGDATSADDNRRAVEGALDRFGRVDAVATFVGAFDHYTALLDLPDDRFGPAFDEAFAVNVGSVLLTARAAADALRASRGSLTVTLSSSSFYPGRGGTLYVATKFALRGAVVQLAHELAPEIRVNGVAPGGTVRTDLRGLRSLGLDKRRLDDRPGRVKVLEARTPLQIALEPVDHAGAYVLLASDRARGMTGEVIRVDGGLGAR